MTFIVHAVTYVTFTGVFFKSYYDMKHGSVFS